MNSKLVQVRLGILGLGLLLLARFISPAGAQDIEGLNLTDRILLTLANSLSQEYQYGPKDLADIRERPDFMIDEEAGAEGQGLGAYAYSFRSQEGPFSGSGYFKIASPTRYRRPKENEGWGEPHAVTGEKRAGFVPVRNGRPDSLLSAVI